MLQVLQEAHSASTIHRDLKPAKVKVSPDGKVLVRWPGHRPRA
jgi:serine/threonine protein kinase